MHPSSAPTASIVSIHTCVRAVEHRCVLPVLLFLFPCSQDIYLLRHDGPVSELNFSPSEVEDVKLISMDQLRDVYAEQVRLLLRDKRAIVGVSVTVTRVVLGMCAYKSGVDIDYFRYIP